MERIVNEKNKYNSIISILSLNSIGLAAKKKNRVNKTIETIVNKVKEKSENTNANTSNGKKSIFNKILRRNDKFSWELVWNDEFDGDTLDSSKWSYRENDYPSKNGNLVIELKKEDNKTVKIDGIDRKILYSSGAIHSKDKYSVKYGKI